MVVRALDWEANALYVGSSGTVIRYILWNIANRSSAKSKFDGEALGK